jgi:hypothetical protein
MSLFTRDSSGQLWQLDVNTDGTITNTQVGAGTTTGTSVSAPSLTGTSLIKSALRAIGAISSGEELRAEELVDGLEALNSMIDSWNADNLMIYSVGRETFTLTIGLNPHTIGLGADLNTTRPKDIALAYIALSDGTELPVEIISKEKYAAIPTKTTSGQPIGLYYDSDYVNGKVYLYYVPDQAYTLVLYNSRPLQQVDASTAFSLPNGYQEALKWNLAVRLAPEYAKAADASLKTIAGLANQARWDIERNNYKAIPLSCDESVMNCNTSDFITRNIKGGW